jgi:hypothetical protein
VRCVTARPLDRTRAVAVLGAAERLALLALGEDLPGSSQSTS